MAASRAKAIAIGVGAVGILGGLSLLTGKPAQAAEEEPKPKPKAKPKKKASPLAEPVALAVKYAKVFDVPASMVIAIIAVQSNNRRDAVNTKNKRGGAWGYGQVTLSTAQDLTKRFPAIAKKYWPKWDGTGKGLLDPNVNVAMTAFQLSLSWKRYKAKPGNWLVSTLAYHQGSGAMDKLLKAGGGKLPAKLPPNATIVAARLNKQKTGNPVVVKALAQERANFSVSGEPLPTKTATNPNIDAMAAKLVTVDQCRAALGAAAVVLNKAYPIADNTPLIAAWAGMRAALHQRIDSVNAYAQRVYAEVSAVKGAPDLTQRKKVALAVLQANDVLADTDRAVNDPELALLPDFLAAIKKILAGVGNAVAFVLPSWALPVGIAAGAGALLLASRK